MSELKVLEVVIDSVEITAVQAEGEHNVVYAKRVIEELKGAVTDGEGKINELSEKKANLVREAVENADNAKGLKALQESATVNKEIVQAEAELKPVTEELEELVQAYKVAEKKAEAEIAKAENERKSKYIVSALNKVTDKVGRITIKPSLVPSIYAVMAIINGEKDVSIEELKKQLTPATKKRGKKSSAVRRENIHGRVKEGDNYIDVKLCKASNRWVDADKFSDKTPSCKEAVKLEREKSKQVDSMKADAEAEKKVFSSNFGKRIDSEAKAKYPNNPAQQGQYIAKNFPKFGEEMKALADKWDSKITDFIESPVVLTETKVYDRAVVEIPQTA